MLVPSFWSEWGWEGVIGGPHGQMPGLYSAPPSPPSLEQQLLVGPLTLCGPGARLYIF